MKRSYVLMGLFLSLLFTFYTAQAAVTASIDRTDIGAGETFVLNIQTDQSNNGQPDLSQIPADFTIVSQSRYQHSQIINGRRTAVQGWQIKLKTLKSGKMMIPAIDVGNESTQPIQLNIRDSSDQLNLNGEEKVLFLEAEIDTQNAYVQQQVIYTVKLYRAVVTHYAGLTEPVVDNAIVEKLGEDEQYDKYINNRLYRVTARRYAIFPQQSGELLISPVNFTAEVSDANRRSRSAFLSATRPVSISTKPIKLQVAPKPVGANEPWLPAQSVTLTDKWTPQLSELKVGEPVTWTIQLTVQGLSESQLPEIKIPPVEGLQWYYDSPQKERGINQLGVVGQRVEKLAVIPSQAGEITLPSITLDWWDTLSDKPMKAVIPERKFKVLPPDASASSIATPVLPDLTGLTNSDSQPKSVQSAWYWPFAATFFFILWLITLLAYWKKSPLKRQTTHKAVEQSNAINVTAQQVAQLTAQSQFKALEKTLLTWLAQTGFENIRSLGALKKHLTNAALIEQINILESLLYAPHKSESKVNIDKTFLKQVFDDLNRRRKNADSQAIPPLYPR